MKQKNDLIRINSDCTVIESTKLLRDMLAPTLSKTQLDIIITIISQVQKYDIKEKYMDFTYTDFLKVINPQNPRTEIVQDMVDKALDSLMGAYFTIRTERYDYRYHWIESTKTDKELNVVHIRITEDVRQFYLDLNKQFTRYLLGDLLALSTIFQACVFRWCQANCNFNNSVLISLDDAKLQFNGDVNIRNDVFFKNLDRAVAKINKKTHLNVSYKKIYEKNKIDRIEFSIQNLLAKHS